MAIPQAFPESVAAIDSRVFHSNYYRGWKACSAMAFHHECMALNFVASILPTANPYCCCAFQGVGSARTWSHSTEGLGLLSQCCGKQIMDISELRRSVRIVVLAARETAGVSQRANQSNRIWPRANAASRWCENNFCISYLLVAIDSISDQDFCSIRINKGNDLKLPPLGGRQLGYRFNFDGFLTYSLRCTATCNWFPVGHSGGRAARIQPNRKLDWQAETDCCPVQFSSET